MQQGRRTLTKRNIPDLSAALELPEGIKTSAQIIEEARRSVRLIPTTRPYTPAGGRNLYSGNTRNRISRPSSNISLGLPTYLEEQIQPLHSQLPLEPLDHEISTISIPPTPVQSVVDIQFTTPTTPEKQHSTNHTPLPPQTTKSDQIPELKTCSSPKTSKRVSSSESNRRNRMTPDRISGRCQVNEQRGTTCVTKREAVKLWDQQVQPLLNNLDKFIEENSTRKSEELIDICNKLWAVLKEGGFHGNTAGQAGKSRRSALLRCLFQLLSVKNPAVIVKLLTIILSMKVIGGNLLKVCQHVFALCRNEDNDRYFIEEDILGPLVNILSTSDPFANIDASVYGLGAIKLLSSNSTLRNNLTSVGVVKMIADHLQKCCGDSKTTLPSSIIVQLIAVLRNLSDSPDVYKEFLSHDIIPLVSQVVSVNKDNPEIIYYTSRFFSKLTLHAECVQCLTKCDGYLSIVPELIMTHNNNEDIIVRLYFILGNLTSTNSSLAYQLYHAHKLHPAINGTLCHYFESLKTAGSQAQSNDMKLKIKDVLVKVIRLIANNCVHQPVAIDFSQQLDSLHLLMDIISYSKSTEDLRHSEELVINILVVFNNLSYFTNDIGPEILESLTNVIIGLLLVNNDKILMECIRVFGNISKYPEVRNIMAHNRVNELLVTLLDSSKVELVYSTCGVLINVTADHQYKAVLRTHHGIKKLTDVLSHFGRQDWQLSSLVCKILCNYSDGESFTEDEVSNISHLLEEFLDPVTAFTAYLMEEDEDDDDEGVSESGSHGDKSQTHTVWEIEFSPVAQLLLRRLTSSN